MSVSLPERVAGASSGKTIALYVLPALICSQLEMGADRVMFSLDRPLVENARYEVDGNGAAVSWGHGEGAQRQRPPPLEAVRTNKDAQTYLSVRPESAIHYEKL